MSHLFDDPVAEALAGAFEMVVLDVFAVSAVQRTLAEHDHPAEADQILDRALLLAIHPA